MTQRRRRTTLLAVLTGMLAVAALWSHGRMAASSVQSAAAAAELADCRRLAGQIERLSKRPALAADTELATAQLAQRIEAAAKRANLPVESILRISPEPARRLGRSPYQDKPTRLDLRDVTLVQLLPFLRTLTDDSRNQLRVRSMRLSAPRDESADERWNAELTLGYLIYNPTD